MLLAYSPSDSTPFCCSCEIDSSRNTTESSLCGWERRHSATPRDTNGKKRACVPPSPPDPDEAAPTLPSAVALGDSPAPPARRCRGAATRHPSGPRRRPCVASESSSRLPATGAALPVSPHARLRSSTSRPRPPAFPSPRDPVLFFNGRSYSATRVRLPPPVPRSPAETAALIA